MALPFQRKPTVEEAALQREYARVLLSLRGYVDVPQQPPTPGDKNITIDPTEVSESDGQNAIDRISITPSFAIPPVAAYVDGKYPLKVHVSYGDYDRVKVSLSVPAGTGLKDGPVTLVWPDRRVVLRQPIRIKRQSTVGLVEFDVDERAPGEFYLSMEFWREPTAVHIGGHEIPPQHYWWDGGSQLIIHVPEDTPSGPVLVLTENRVFTSPEPFSRTAWREEMGVDPMQQSPDDLKAIVQQVVYDIVQEIVRHKTAEVTDANPDTRSSRDVGLDLNQDEFQEAYLGSGLETTVTEAVKTREEVDQPTVTGSAEAGTGRKSGQARRDKGAS